MRCVMKNTALLAAKFQKSKRWATNTTQTALRTAKQGKTTRTMHHKECILQNSCFFCHSPLHCLFAKSSKKAPLNKSALPSGVRLAPICFCKILIKNAKKQHFFATEKIHFLHFCAKNSQKNAPFFCVKTKKEVRLGTSFLKNCFA